MSRNIIEAFYGAFARHAVADMARATAGGDLENCPAAKGA
jgi:hypothetical protein